MKKMIFALMTMLTMTIPASALNYEQARQEALFLTDKMAYELNLTDQQYEAAYEINLDYLMSVTGRNNVYGPIWERRNLDLSYILLDWQWNAFLAASYFYRPLYWEAGYWHFGIYARYPHRNHYYFGRPHFYGTYRGAHSWHRNGGRSYYLGRRDHYRRHVGPNRVGMHDRLNRGDYRGRRPSTTRYTAGPRANTRRIEGRNRAIERNNRVIQRQDRQIQRQREMIGRQDRQIQRGNRQFERSNRQFERSNRQFERSSRPSQSRSSFSSSPSRGRSQGSSSRSYSGTRGGGSHGGGSHGMHSRGDRGGRR